MTATIGKSILIGTDFSEHAEHAMAIACELARAMDGTVHFLHVVQMPIIPGPDIGVMLAGPVVEDVSGRARRMLDEQTRRWQDRCRIGRTEVAVGDPRACLVEVAREVSADLVVVGTHGRRGIGRMLMGSVAEHVVRTCPVPVLAVPLG